MKSLDEVRDFVFETYEVMLDKGCSVSTQLDPEPLGETKLYVATEFPSEGFTGYFIAQSLLNDPEVDIRKLIQARLEMELALLEEVEAVDAKLNPGAAGE